MLRDYNNILNAHFKTKLPLMLWGSSGYGKTSIVNDFASRFGFELVVLHAQYLDPLSLFIPSTSEMEELGYVKVYPSQLLHKIFNCKQKTVLFLDELTRAREETFNILTELLLDRKVFGYSVPEHVLIVAASNFLEEDTGVRELPDAVMQRLTHLIHAPDSVVSASHLKSKSLRTIIEKDPKMIRAPGKFLIHDLLKACPRQLDACGLLAEAGLTGDELSEVCRGRVGVEVGSDLAVRLQMQLSGRGQLLPDAISPGDFVRVSVAEKECGVLEVVSYLREQLKFSDRHGHVANYLLEYASPETCRALQIHGFSYTFQGIPRKVNGQLFQVNARVDSAGSQAVVATDIIQTAGRPWQWYAIKLGKMTAR